MHEASQKSDMSVLQWMGTQLLLCIPIVNLIPLIIWAIFSKKPSKRYFAIAYLIWILVFCLLALLALIFFHTPIVNWLQHLLEARPVVN